jgi:hypothetical protein
MSTFNAFRFRRSGAARPRRPRQLLLVLAATGLFGVAACKDYHVVQNATDGPDGGADGLEAGTTDGRSAADVADVGQSDDRLDGGTGDETQGDGGQIRGDGAQIDRVPAEDAAWDGGSVDVATVDGGPDDSGQLDEGHLDAVDGADRGGGCVDPTSPTSCGSRCQVCAVPTNGDHATCDGSSCSFVCRAGFHACGPTCVDDRSISSCGTACGACPTPTGGSASCDGKTCGMTCPAASTLCGDTCIPSGAACNGACLSAMHNCGGTCRSNSDANFCGTACERCSAPQNGAAVCNGACGVKCNAGFNLCGTSCKAATDPTACGPSCTRCDVPVGGSATCDGTTCGTPTCPSGQKLCSGACIDQARSCNGVCSNGKYSCPDGVCRDTNTVTSCGTGCQPCPQKPNATATSCTNAVCGYTCNAGFFLCGDGSCGRRTWDFEGGDLQAVYALTQNSNSFEMVSVRTDVAHSGTHALAGRLLNNEDFYFVDIRAPLCGTQGADLTGRTISAWVLSPVRAYICIQDTCTVAEVAQWTYVETTQLGSASEVKILVMGGGPWNGRVYVDDITVSP